MNSILTSYPMSYCLSNINYKEPIKFLQIIKSDINNIVLSFLITNNLKNNFL